MLSSPGCSTKYLRSSYINLRSISLVYSSYFVVSKFLQLVSCKLGQILDSFHYICCGNFPSTRQNNVVLAFSSRNSRFLKWSVFLKGIRCCQIFGGYWFLQTMLQDRGPYARSLPRVRPLYNEDVVHLPWMIVIVTIISGYCD